MVNVLDICGLVNLDILSINPLESHTYHVRREIESTMNIYVVDTMKLMYWGSVTGQNYI